MDFVWLKAPGLPCVDSPVNSTNPHSFIQQALYDLWILVKRETAVWMIQNGICAKFDISSADGSEQRSFTFQCDPLPDLKQALHEKDKQITEMTKMMKEKDEQICVLTKILQNKTYEIKTLHRVMNG